MSVVEAPRILVGIVGSHAYGLATESSDTDRMAIAVLPTRRFLGVHPPTADALTYHRAGEGDDITVHEVGKFVSLCLKANPTVTELLWLDEYETTTSLGMALVENRSVLLGSVAVRGAYLGYLTAQIKGAASALAKPKAAKYARHAWRLAHQAQSLWLTGRLRVRLDPEEAIQAARFGAEATPDSLGRLVDVVRDTMELPTPLPAQASFDWADAFLADQVRPAFQTEKV